MSTNLKISKSDSHAINDDFYDFLGLNKIRQILSGLNKSTNKDWIGFLQKMIDLTPM